MRYYFIIVFVTILQVITEATISQNLKMDSLINELKNTKEDTNKVNILNKLSVEYIITGEPAKAHNYLLKALDLAQKIEFIKGAAVSYQNIGIIHGDNGDYFLAIENYLKSLSIYMELKDERGIAGLYSNIGNIYYNQGNYSEAGKYYLRSQLLREKIGDKPGMAISYNNTGLIYWNLGNYIKALEYFYKSIEIKEKLGGKSGIAVTLENIGLIYSAQNNYDKALEYYFKSLSIKKELGDKNGMAKSYNNIGTIYDNQADYSQALKYYLKSLEINVELGDKKGISRSYNNIGENMKIQRNYSRALEFFIKSLKIRELIGDKQGIASSFNNIGALYIELGEYKIALDYCKKGLETAKEVGEKELIKDAYMHLVTLYEKSNDIHKAYENYQLYTLIKDSVLNEISIRQINELQIKYETEKKDKEIELLAKEKKIKEMELNKKQEQIRLQIILSVLILTVVIFLSVLLYILYRNKQIRKQNELQQELNKYMQKALSQQMNPHFIFNTLNSIQYYILNNDKITSNKYLTMFARLMRMTLENAQNHTIPIKNELDALTLYMDIESIRFKDKFEYNIIFDKNSDILSYKIPTLLIQPYVENSILHGLMNKNGNGKINIELILHDNIIICSIEDNGIGREKAMELKKQKNISHKSLGTEITETRLNLLNLLFGSDMNVEFIDLKDEKGGTCGTKVIIKFPVIE